MVRRVLFLVSNAAVFLLLGTVASMAIPAGTTGWPSAGVPAGPRDCSMVDGTTLAAGVSTRAPVANYQGRGAIDDEAVLTGYVLTVQIEDGTEITTNLPVESIFAGQFGALLLYSLDTDRTGSEVHAIDVRTGCDLVLVKPADVVRAVTVDPNGEYIYVKTVRRDTREDLGVWRYEVGGKQGEAVVDPMPATDYGPSWYTTLAWSADGQSLVIDACRQAVCATRIRDLVTGKVEDFLDPHGQVIGVNDLQLFAFAATDHRPGDLLAINRADATVRIIAGEVVTAKLRPDGETLWIETLDGTSEVRP